MPVATMPGERATATGVIELLFVEDERSLAHAIQESLSTARGVKFRVTYAALLEDALQKLAERDFDVLLLVLYVDVDGLKQCNDTYGHNKGDVLLRRVARVLNRTFRESDVVGRLGGDEFAILSLDAASESADALLARLNRNLELENQGESD